MIIFAEWKCCVKGNVCDVKEVRPETKQCVADLAAKLPDEANGSR